jgi:hypothetical protein
MDKNIKETLNLLVSGGNTMVEGLTHNPKLIRLNPVTSGTGRRK